MDQPASGRGSLALLRRLLRERVGQHVGRLGLAALFMALAAASTAANAWLLEPAVDQVFIAKSASMLWLVPLAALLVAAIKAAASYAQDVLVGGVGQRIIADTQVALYRHLITADLAYLQSVHSGKLIASFLYDVQLLRETVSRALTGVAKDGLTFVALSAVMFWQDWKLAALTLLVFPPIAFAIRRLGRRMRKASGKTQAETGRLSAHLAETLEGARIVKAYGREDYEIGRAQAAVERRLAHIMKAVRTRSAAAPSTEALGGLAVALAILYGGWQAQQGSMTLGAFTSFLAALLMAYQPLKSLATFNTAIQEGLAAAERIFALLDTRPAIGEVADAPELRLTAGQVRFEAVGFAYAGGRAALSGVDLTVPAGKVVALVGASGAGKSTLLNLIPRFYDVSAGAVRIDGQDVRQVSLRSLRAAVGLVAQEAQLFDDTVAANIAYGRPGASREAIVAAARAAAAHDFIAALPQGYDTAVGENGVRLSGGQRQRLAIARAMLKDAPILLLDEATSALDAESERQVQEALRRLMHGRTTLLIAHRLSTVQSADEIHVLDGGRIVETGSHRDLLARAGTYARLHALQAQGAEAEARPGGTGS
ncbi:MAG: ABC transporter ATP-binding protein [Alphaproteobacteria bacterium]|nr:ABC transporter ATP-binding protein [Alphaproteobacteria bacterium]